MKTIKITIATLVVLTGLVVGSASATPLSSYQTAVLAEPSLISYYDLVSVDWKRTGSDAVEMTVEIPANAEADVWIPGKNSSLHLGSGRHTLRFKISTQHGDFQKEHSD